VLRTLALITALLAPGLAAAGAQPGGAPVPHGITVEATADGSDFLAAVFGGILPESLEVGFISGSACCLRDPVFGNCVDTVSYDASGLTVLLDIAELHVLPEPPLAGNDGRARVELGLDVRVNDPTDPFSFAASTAAGQCALSVGSCNAMWLESARVDTTVHVDVSVSPGPGGYPIVDVSIPTPTHNAQAMLTAQNLQSDACQNAILTDLLNSLGVEFADLLLGPFITYLERDFPTYLQALIEQTFRSRFTSRFDLLGGTINLELYADGVHSDGEFLRVQLGAVAGAPERAECIIDRDDDGFQISGSALGPLMSLPPGGVADHHLAGIIDDDFLNSLFHALWKSGALCQRLEDLLDLLGPDASQVASFLGTGLLDLGETFASELARVRHDEKVNGGPMKIELLAGNPPTVSFGGDHDATVDLEGLEVAFYTPLLGRWAHLLTARVHMALGLDLGVSPYGEILITPSIDLSDPRTGIARNEVMPAANGDIAENMGPWLETLVNQLGANALDTFIWGPLTYTLNTPGGSYTLAFIQGEAGTVGADRLGGFLLLGMDPPPPPGGNQSCMSLTSCVDPNACTSPLCSHIAPGPSLGPAMLLVPVLVMAWVRRRP
jgi:hypothetical protein